MIGAIIGDIVGSRFEWNNIKSKNFNCILLDAFLLTITLMKISCKL